MAKGKYKEWLTKEGLIKIEGWAKDGLSNQQIAHNIGITEETYYKWQKKYAEFYEAIKKGKEVVDREVENSLNKRANGFTQIVKKVKFTRGGEMIEYEEEVYFPPDTTALIFWLKNRKPAEWRDKPDEANNTAQDSIKILAEVIRESRKNEA
jgi:hypothetical protein